jgi:hypothetical protein
VVLSFWVYFPCNNKFHGAPILNEHSSALRSTSRYGFVGVPNALNLELNLLRLLEVTFVLASWRGRVALQSGESPLRLACCARGRFVLYRSVVGGGPRTPLLRCARPHRCAWLYCACKRAVCACFSCEVLVCAEKSITPPFLSLSLSLLFAHFPAHRDLHEAPYHVAVLENPTACDWGLCLCGVMRWCSAC